MTTKTICPARVVGREPCRYDRATEREHCALHGSQLRDPARLDTQRWCGWQLYGRSDDARCQGFVLSGSEFCLRHDPREREKPKERQARMTVLSSIGNNASALVLLLEGLVTRDHSKWQSIAAVADEEGLLRKAVDVRTLPSLERDALARELLSS